MRRASLKLVDCVSDEAVDCGYECLDCRIRRTDLSSGRQKRIYASRYKVQSIRGVCQLREQCVVSAAFKS